MIAPTHIAFAVACSLIGGVPSPVVKLVGAGALLPDIDHPQSALGRVFFFLSIPLNKAFGHRQQIHSIILWFPLTVAGFIIYPNLGWIGLGAISHIIIDCLNTSGVALFIPITEKIFVLAGRKYRISTGSRHEFILLMFLGMIAYGGGYIGSKGGIRTLIASFVGNYKMAVEHYLTEGNKICYLEGKLRHSSGQIEKGKWLIIGTEGQNKLAIFDEQKKEIYHIGQGSEKFIKTRLKTTQKKWNSLKIAGIANLITGDRVFYKAKNRWHIANIGDFVAGDILYIGKCVLDTI